MAMKWILKISLQLEAAGKTIATVTTKSSGTSIREMSEAMNVAKGLAEAARLPGEEPVDLHTVETNLARLRRN